MGAAIWLEAALLSPNRSARMANQLQRITGWLISPPLITRGTSVNVFWSWRLSCSWSRSILPRPPFVSHPTTCAQCVTSLPSAMCLDYRLFGQMGSKIQLLLLPLGRMPPKIEGRNFRIGRVLLLRGQPLVVTCLPLVYSHSTRRFWVALRGQTRGNSSAISTSYLALRYRFLPT